MIDVLAIVTSNVYKTTDSNQFVQITSCQCNSGKDDRASVEVQLKCCSMLRKMNVYFPAILQQEVDRKYAPRCCMMWHADRRCKTAHVAATWLCSSF